MERPRSQNHGGALLRATEKRFLKLETTGEGVSPSAYDTPDLLPNGGRGATMAGRQALRTESGGASAAFRSDSRARIRLHDASMVNTQST